MNILLVGANHNPIYEYNDQGVIGKADVIHIKEPEKVPWPVKDGWADLCYIINEDSWQTSQMEECHRTLNQMGELWIRNNDWLRDRHKIETAGFDIRTAVVEPNGITSFMKNLVPANYDKSVSIIVPGLITTGFLEKALTNLKETTDWNLVKEIIVVCEGGSLTDVAFKLPDMPAPMRVLWGPEPSGVTTAMRLGYQAAQGYFAVVIDDGATMSKGWLKKLVDGIVSHSEVGVVSMLPKEHISVKFMIACALVWMPALRRAGLPDAKHLNRGPFDDDCLEIRFIQSGFRLGAVGNCIISHPEGGTTGSYRSRQDIANRWAEKSNIIQAKYGTIPRYGSYDVLMIGKDER